MSDASEQPLVSCLCVTENRHAFLPWLFWSFDRQVWRNKELVVVDSSRQSPDLVDRKDVRVLPVAPGTSVAAKRNVALGAARGTAIAWFDDDDWQHPLRLALTVPPLGSRFASAGPVGSWILDIWSERTWRYPGFDGDVVFNGSAFAADPARSVRFDERRHRASDTVWMTEFTRLYGQAHRVGSTLSTFLWLHHGANLSISPARSALARVLRPATCSGLKAALGNDSWGDTDARLEALRMRLQPRNCRQLPKKH